MKRHWKKIVGAVVIVIVLIVGGSWFYASFLTEAPAKLAPADLVIALDANVPPATGADFLPTTSGQPTSRAPNDVTGVWRAVSTSVVRYRVNESINGFDATAVGATDKISGTVTIEGERVRAAGFTVDMNSFTSDESKRDRQFRGRVMDVAQFPTATFNITSPIQFTDVPAEGKTLQTRATGDLTLRGTTRSVTFDLVAMTKNGKIGIFGNIPVVFADYGIPNPSFATVSTADHGELEFIVVLVRS